MKTAPETTEITIGAGYLAEHLTEVPEHVRSGHERFVVVERDGRPLAAIGPTKPQPGITVGEFFALLRDAPRPDDGFVDLLEAIQAAQPRMPDPPELPD